MGRGRAVMVFFTSKQVLMAYLETWDFLGVRVARDLTAYLAAPVCRAKRWVPSIPWVAICPRPVTNQTH